MNKSEILNRLKSSRDWNHYDQENSNWQDAFTLYNAAHGLSGKERLRMNCNKCVNLVREWLETEMV